MFFHTPFFKIGQKKCGLAGITLSSNTADMIKTELEKCLAGELFNGADPELSRMTLNAKRILRALNDADYADVRLRYQMLKQLFGRIGENVCVDIDFHCEYGRNILCGDRVIINMNCTFVDNNIIEIGDDVLIASNVQLYTATHSIRLRERVVEQWRPGHEICHTFARPIKIGDGVWIGGGAIVLPGVTIGEHSVIGAGSVVTRSIPPDCVAVGNPCRVIKTIDNG